MYISSALLNTYNNTINTMNYSQRLYNMTNAYTTVTATVEHKLCMLHAFAGNALLTAATHQMGEATRHAQHALDIQQNRDALYEQLTTIDYTAIAKRTAVMLGKALLLLLWVAVVIVTVAGYSYYRLLRYLAVEMGRSVDETPAAATPATVKDVPAYGTYMRSYEAVCGNVTSDDEYEQMEREFAEALAAQEQRQAAQKAKRADRRAARKAAKTTAGTN